MEGKELGVLIKTGIIIGSDLDLSPGFQAHLGIGSVKVDQVVQWNGSIIHWHIWFLIFCVFFWICMCRFPSFQGGMTIFYLPINKESTHQHFSGGAPIFTSHFLLKQLS